MKTFIFTITLWACVGYANTLSCGNPRLLPCFFVPLALYAWHRASDLGEIASLREFLKFERNARKMPVDWTHRFDRIAENTPNKKETECK